MIAVNRVLEQRGVVPVSYTLRWVTLWGQGHISHFTRIRDEVARPEYTAETLIGPRLRVSLQIMHRLSGNSYRVDANHVIC